MRQSLFLILLYLTTSECSFAFLDQLLPSGEWQVNKSLAECNEYLFRHKVAADVTFVVSYKDGPSRGTPVSFQAHRLLLLARSPVFFDMFHVNTSFSSQQEIEVTDIDPDAFNEMLRFIYYDEAEIVAENVLYVLQASKKYKLPNLALKCSEFLEEKLDASNVFGILEHSIFFKDQRLIDKALNLIRDNGKVALSSAAFSKLSHKAVGQVLDMDVISAREIDIFNACMKWAWAECIRQDLEKNTSNARLVLGKHLYKIRFPTMSLKEFADQVVITDVLSTEEGYTVFQYMTCTAKPGNILFPIERRRGLPTDLVILSHLLSKNLQPGYDRSSTITLEIDHDIKLAEILYHGLQNKADAQYHHAANAQYSQEGALYNQHNYYITIDINIKQNRKTLFESRSTKEFGNEHKMINSVYPFISVPLGDGINISNGEFTIWTKYKIGYTSSCCAYDNVKFLSLRSTSNALLFSDDYLKASVSSSEDVPFLGFKYVMI